MDYQKFDIVVALDVFEHFEPERVAALLTDLKKRIKHNFYVIVTMPIVDWKTPVTWIAWAEKMLYLGRKTTGLFDPTHIILQDRDYHRKMLEKAGYKVVIDELINQVNGISGNWRNIYPNRATWMKYTFTKISRFLVDVLGWIFHPIDSHARYKLREYLGSNRSFFVIIPVR